MGGSGTPINCYMNWTMEMLLPQNKLFQLKLMLDEWKEKSSKCQVISLSMVSVVNKTGPRFSNYRDVSGSWCCGTFFNSQPLFSHGIAASTEYVCFSQMSGLLTLQYKSYHCIYSIRTAFMSICCVLALEGLYHTTKQRISIR